MTLLLLDKQFNYSHDTECESSIGQSSEGIRAGCGGG